MNCKDCGATVTPSDRFCPACGTPNLHAARHPKFGPEPRAFEPAILDDRAAVGEPCCPRCERPLTPPDETCRGCGMTIGRSLHARAERMAIAERQRGPHRSLPYRSLDELGAAARLLCTVVAVIGTVFGLGQLWRLARLENTLTAGPAERDLTRALDALGAMGLAAGVVTAIALYGWARRGIDNLPALAIPTDGISRRMGRTAWLVPGLNVYRPKQRLDDLWRSGDRDLAMFDPSWRRAPVPGWSMTVWASGLAALVIGVTSRVVAAGAPAVEPGTAPSLEAVAAAAMAAVAGLFVAVAAFGLQDLVVRIGERQDDRRRTLGAAEVATVTRSASPTSERAVSAALRQPTGDGQVLWGRY